jgi:5-methylthioribose kinase
MSAARGDEGYRILDAGSVPGWLAGLPAVRARLGGVPDDWTVREVGDGNLNLVFLVEGTEGSVCVKQALPYVRAAGPSWPMSPARADFENAYYTAVAPYVGALIPTVFHYEPSLYCLVMERLSPHVILRHGLIDGRRYEHAARDVGEFVALSAFHTSDLAVPFERKFDGIARFAANKALVRITVDLVFIDPYVDAARNRHTAPQLDAAVARIRGDAELKAAAARCGARFLASPQALVHGDLHSGSIMVTAEDTRVIDPEFAFYGPIGFDLGAFLGNLWLNWYAQAGRAGAGDDRRRYRTWILDQAKVFWNTFSDRFLGLWAAGGGGDAWPAALFDTDGGAAARRAAQRAYIDALFADMVAFAACKMVRRIVGFAHVLDLDGIADPDRRAACERGALQFARALLVHPEQYDSIDDLLEAVPRWEEPQRFG